MKIRKMGEADKAKENGLIRPAELALEKMDPEAYYRLRAEKLKF